MKEREREGQRYTGDGFVSSLLMFLFYLLLNVLTWYVFGRADCDYKKGIIVRIPICFHKLTEQILDNQVTSHMISFNSVSVSIGMEYVIEE